MKKKMATYNLCGKTGCCPEVNVEKDTVTIGEEGSMVKLKRDEWDSLVKKIKSGKIR